MENRTEKHQVLCNTLNAIYKTKNKKYGNSFTKTWKEYGPMMLCIRLDDKLGRTKQLLLRGEEETDDESIIDTLLDMANYCLMGILEIEGRDEDDKK